METPFCLEILGVHIYYLDGVEMSNENGVLRKLLWLYSSFPYYAVSLALGARIAGKAVKNSQVMKKLLGEL